MVQQSNLTIQNNFIAGLKTQFTGLNFPENAATDSQNVIYTLTGDVIRRQGINYELNFFTNANSDRTQKAMSSYKWNNVGGDGQTQIVVVQIGNQLFFYQSSAATIASPLSNQRLVSTVSLLPFQAPGTSNDISVTECNYADGNGYLFIFHQDCDPIFCTFTPGGTPFVQANRITVQIRDFFGIYPEPGNPSLTNRPTSLTASHNYNLRNQGWTSNTLWSSSGTSPPNTLNFGGLTVSANTITLNTGSTAFIIDPNIVGISVGQSVNLNYGGSANYLENGLTFRTTGWQINNAQGTVTAYTPATGNVTINIVNAGSATFSPSGGAITGLTIVTEVVSVSVTSNINTISTWNTALGNFPSNADVWWRFKDTSDKFNPSVMVNNVTLPNAQAPNGSFIYNAFVQNRTAATGISGLTSISTTLRPNTGCWFAGRVFYTGVNASQSASNELGFYTWTENIYFSQIITSSSQFGYCYQQNDPTDQDLFDILPDDGGVITIQGSGAIYRLVPVQNGLLVFAANGVWFITGSQGIGFAANDYTITKISGVQSISRTSYVNVLGYPMFWNEEGIYYVSPGQNGALEVEPITVSSILSFYAAIPLQSKKFARGDYNPIDYEVQWVFRSTNESDITSRYSNDRILIFNVNTKAFYYYTLPTGNGIPSIHDIRYVAGPGGSTSPSPTFKYLTSVSNNNLTWSEERDNTYVDWISQINLGINFVSYFVAGYNLHGKAYARWQPVYAYIFLRNGINNSYKVQGQWDFAISGNSGKFSTVQVINDTTSTSNFGMVFRRHKIRGHGLAFQLRIQSVDGKPFDIMGWSLYEAINQGV